MGGSAGDGLHPFANKNLSSKKQNSGKILSGETFSLFLEKAIQLLRPDGRLSFILPESILNIRTHADIREFILSETKIQTITLLGRAFTGVFTPVIRLDLIKEIAPEDWQACVNQETSSNPIRQHRFLGNPHLGFDIATRGHEEELLDKIYSIPYATLAGNAEWALGIVTGDKKKYVLDTPISGAEAVFRGSDVSRFRLTAPKSYLRFTPQDFQQVAPERIYRAPEKLIYKFIRPVNTVGMLARIKSI